MKNLALTILNCLLFAGFQPAFAQYVTGDWKMNEGSGTSVANTSPNNANWNMTLSGNPGLWGYWQPGAYSFAAGFGGNVNNFRTALTSAAGWTSGDALTLKADFNVTSATANNSSDIFKGGTVFGAGYFTPGGNGLGWNYGAFMASVNTSVPASPTISFGVSGIGNWSQPLPSSVTDKNINAGWNTAEWQIVNNAGANSMTIQFRINGVNVGSPATSTGILRDFTDYGDYTGTKFYIGAQADQDYNTFTGSIRNVSLVASVVPEPSMLAFAGLAGLGLILFGRKSNSVL